MAVATPPPKPTTEELDGDTRGVQCSASLSTGLLSKLRELGCIRLQIFENGSVARGTAGSSSQDPSSKRGGKNLNLEQESGFWKCAHLDARLPHILFLYSNSSRRQDSLLC